MFQSQARTIFDEFQLKILFQLISDYEAGQIGTNSKIKLDLGMEKILNKFY